MYLQRIIMPTGKVSWTCFDDRGSVVPEIREFVLYLEARHYAPSTVKHYAKHVVRLGNYLGAFGKGYRHRDTRLATGYLPAASASRPLASPTQP